MKRFAIAGLIFLIGFCAACAGPPGRIQPAERNDGSWFAYSNVIEDGKDARKVQEAKNQLEKTAMKSSDINALFAFLKLVPESQYRAEGIEKYKRAIRNKVLEFTGGQSERIKRQKKVPGCGSFAPGSIVTLKGNFTRQQLGCDMYSWPLDPLKIQGGRNGLTMEGGDGVILNPRDGNAYVIGSSLLQEEPIGRNGKTGLEPAASRRESFKLGLACQLTGPLAQSGAKYYQEISAGIDKINAAGGIGGRPMHLFGTAATGELPDGFKQYRNMTFFTFDRSRQLTGWNDGRSYHEYKDALVCDAFDSTTGKTKTTDCLEKLAGKNVLAILSQVSKSEMAGIAGAAERKRIPLVFFTTKPETVSLPDHHWVFAATPSNAVAAVAHALKEAGPDREGIRKALAVRLGKISSISNDALAVPAISEGAASQARSSLKVWTEQAGPGSPVTVHWSPNPISDAPQIRFQFIKCKPESATGSCEGSLHAGIGNSSAPLTLTLPGPGRYSIKLSDFMSDRDVSDWVFFHAK